MKYLGSTGMLWTVLVCSGQYRYALGSTGMLWAVLVWFWDRYALDSTGMLWVVLVLLRAFLLINSFHHLTYIRK